MLHDNYNYNWPVQSCGEQYYFISRDSRIIILLNTPDRYIFVVTHFVKQLKQTTNWINIRKVKSLSFKKKLSSLIVFYCTINIITWLFCFNKIKSLLHSRSRSRKWKSRKNGKKGFSRVLNRVSRLNYNDMAIIIYPRVAIIKTIAALLEGVAPFRIILGYFGLLPSENGRVQATPVFSVR